MKNRLKKLIKLLGITQKEFAKSINVGPGNVNDWLRGRSEPSSKALRKIYEVYKVAPLWLLTGEGPMYKWEEDKKIQVLKTEIEGLLKEKALIDEKIDAINKALEELDIEKRAILLDSILNLLKLNSP